MQQSIHKDFFGVVLQRVWMQTASVKLSPAEEIAADLVAVFKVSSWKQGECCPRLSASEEGDSQL